MYSRTLWVSAMNSPMRLGVSPAAASTPIGIFNQRFEALFPQTGTLRCVVCLAPQLFLLVCLHANVRPPSSQSAALRSPPAAALPAPVLLPVWMNDSSLTPWLSDFHTVQFSASSGCFLFLNLLLTFFWLCKEAQCVYLHLHLGQ